jgi:hypothetical protein
LLVSQIKPSVTNPTIANIYQAIESKSLVLKPDFQRKFVWTHEHQEDFIDTILKGFPFPEIYVCEAEIDVSKLTTSQNVIDGQQRLTTIKRYIEGVQERPLQKVPAFADLGSAAKDFLSYQVVVRDIGNVPDEVVREVFRRINLTKFKLDDVEIHNAIYDGSFIQAAKEVLDATSLKQYGVFHDSEFTRMADLHFVLLVMATLEAGGYFPEDKEVEATISAFNDTYERSEPMKALLLSVFDVVTKLDLPADSIWFRKSNFFTLVVETAKHIDNIPLDMRSRLIVLDENIIANKRNSANEYGKYYQYMYQGTNQRKARVIRSDLFSKEIFG